MVSEHRWLVNTGDAEGTQATVLFHLHSKKWLVPFSPGGAHGTKGSVAGGQVRAKMTKGKGVKLIIERCLWNFEDEMR